MDPIHFTCPQGHKIRAKAELAGKLASCPRCKSVMMIPEPIRKLVNRRSAITESGVMRILGDVSPLPPAPPKSTYVARSCPRCRKSLRPSATICENCQLYVGINIGHDRRLPLSEFEA